MNVQAQTRSYSKKIVDFQVYQVIRNVRLGRMAIDTKEALSFASQSSLRFHPFATDFLFKFVSLRVNSVQIVSPSPWLIINICANL